MRPPNSGWSGYAALWLVRALVPVAFLETLRTLNGAPFSAAEAIGRWGWVLGVLLLARAGALQPAGRFRWCWSWRGVAVFPATLAAIAGYVVTEATVLAWTMLGMVYAGLIILARGTWTVAAGIDRRWLRGLSRLALLGAALAAGGLLPVAAAQIESHFADEEFFVFLQALALSLFFGLMLAVLMRPSEQTFPSERGLRIDARLVWGGLLLLAAAGVWTTVRSYQASFYPPEAPAFVGISPEQPFLCGKAASPGAGHPNGEAVFQRLLARVEANPQKRPPEYGMLALATSERRWAEDFRRAVLEEARENRFAGPAHSVKSIQYEAALRLYYVWKVQGAFPDLFDPSDQTLLREWFAAINKRALTVEWVDWTYALAFSKWPEGPYENQENGAGLLALLEVSGYAASELSAANREYLARNERGWRERFRNTDDAYVYQLEWLHNARFQSLYAPRLEPSNDNRQLSFEWLLLQSLPDGAVLRYNHPARASVAGMAYLGASLLKDPNLLWLADRALTRVEAEKGYLRAQPGLEEPVNLLGEPPAEGSCLLYGDSGLPNQVGPLAPDKIAFRDGWSTDATYALLNLRFSGWHRHKATNTLTLLYQDRPIVTEQTMGLPFAWLPEGRSLFRDKRIPRENLNGLLIDRTGMSAVLYNLTGVGGPWAQDPPYYAEVVAFETGDDLDWSHTRLSDWRGWQHDRWIYFHHGGPVVLMDRAEGPPSAQAALAWHLHSEEWQAQGDRFRLEGDLAEVVLGGVENGALERGAAEMSVGPDGAILSYKPAARGHLQTMTVFLMDEWVGSEVDLNDETGQLMVEVSEGEKRIVLFMDGLFEQAP